MAFEANRPFSSGGDPSDRVIICSTYATVFMKNKNLLCMIENMIRSYVIVLL